MNTLIGPTVKHVRNDTVFVLLILLGLQFITWAIKEIHALTVFLCLTFSRTNSLKPWNSLEEGDEASQKPNLRQFVYYPSCIVSAFWHFVKAAP